jgi:hypothetical protein
VTRAPDREVIEQIGQFERQRPSDADQRCQRGVGSSRLHATDVRRLDTITLRGFLDGPATLSAEFSQAPPQFDHDATKGR